MRTIIPNQPFKHETETYEPGQRYEVSDEDAEYFDQCGWLGDGDMYDGSAYNGEHSLSIDNVMLGHSAEVN